MPTSTLTPLTHLLLTHTNIHPSRYPHTNTHTHTHTHTPIITVSYRVPVGGEAPLCFLVNTGEYCAEVVPQLESLIKLKMLPSLADRVDLGQEADMFMDLVAHALKVRPSLIFQSTHNSPSQIFQSNYTAPSQIAHSNHNSLP